MFSAWFDSLGACFFSRVKFYTRRIPFQRDNAVIDASKLLKSTRLPLRALALVKQVAQITVTQFHIDGAFLAIVEDVPTNTRM